MVAGAGRRSRLGLLRILSSQVDHRKLRNPKRRGCGKESLAKAKRVFKAKQVNWERDSPVPTKLPVAIMRWYSTRVPSVEHLWLVGVEFRAESLS